MIKFLDGPAAGVVLPLRRAPVMLRVVQDRAGKWDALDQLEDEAKPGEAVHVYRIVAPPTFIHLLIRGKGRGGSGYYPHADYRHLPDQPGDANTRTNEAWAAWCDANRDQYDWKPEEAGGVL